MSIQSEIDRINAGVAAAYAVLSGMGANLPSEQTVDNLAATVASVMIGTTNIQDAAVTRAKLSNDALFSPILNVSTTEENINLSMLGKTLWPTAWGQDKTFHLTMAGTADIPQGAEIAIVRWGDASAGDVYISSNDVRACTSGQNFITANKTFRISAPYGMAALKKLSDDAWLFTGNVEVVE